jgi:hypothetical protein
LFLVLTRLFCTAYRCRYTVGESGGSRRLPLCWQDPLIFWKRPAANTRESSLEACQGEACLSPGKSTSGRKIEDYYNSWRKGLPENIGIRTDSVRLFTKEQKDAMFKRDGPVCPMCRKDLALSDAEGDHYPVAWRDGGRTVIENGRMVHKTCPYAADPLEASNLTPIEF